MKYAFKPIAPVTLPIVNSNENFPIRRIYCVGKNYADHIIEMGGNSKRSEPVFFTKSPQALIKNYSKIPYPRNTTNLHYEVELVVAIGPNGVFGYSVGLDMTRRNVQKIAKDKGGPWTRAKDFPNSAICSDITLINQVEIQNAEIKLFQNNKIVQKSNISKLIWSINEIMSYLESDMDLKPGDLIYTGTPAGVGPVLPGDTLLGQIDGLETINVKFI
mgnify:FL=1